MNKNKINERGQDSPTDLQLGTFLCTFRCVSFRCRIQSKLVEHLHLSHLPQQWFHLAATVSCKSGYSLTFPVFLCTCSGQPSHIPLCIVSPSSFASINPSMTKTNPKFLSGSGRAMIACAVGSSTLPFQHILGKMHTTSAHLQGKALGSCCSGHWPLWHCWSRRAIDLGPGLQQ